MGLGVCSTSFGQYYPNIKIVDVNQLSRIGKRLEIRGLYRVFLSRLV